MIVVLNANTLGISEYDLDPIDVASVNGEPHLLLSDSLASLDASGDERVEFSVQTGQLRFGTPLPKRVLWLYPFLRSSGYTLVTTILDKDDSGSEHTQQLPGTGVVPREWPVKLGRTEVGSIGVSFSGAGFAEWALYALSASFEPARWRR